MHSEQPRLDWLSSVLLRIQQGAHRGDAVIAFKRQPPIGQGGQGIQKACHAAARHQTVLLRCQQVYNNCKFLAVADEEGFISILDTVAPLPRSTADDDEPKPRAQWLAHKNAVFDIAWAKVR
jgi:hypothetical protein